MKPSETDKELERLGVINIESNSGIDEDLKKDVIRAINELNLDFNELANEIEICKANPSK